MHCLSVWWAIDHNPEKGWAIRLPNALHLLHAMWQFIACIVGTRFIASVGCGGARLARSLLPIRLSRQNFSAESFYCVRWSPFHLTGSLDGSTQKYEPHPVNMGVRRIFAQPN